MKIAILLCSYNGERFILEQLKSIQEQSYTDWSLYVSDDGSTDNTLGLIESWVIENSFQDRVHFFVGPKLGFANNFLSLAANRKIEADLFFWADQDDIWHFDKLERTIEVFRHQDAANPILYCGRTILVDSKNVKYGLSPLQNKYPPSFGNALVQSLGGGNTMAFNVKARELIALAFGSEVPSHDWWAYLIVSGSGGTVIYDPEPRLRYRQHATNMIGSNKSLKAKFQRVYILFNGSYRVKIDKNLNLILLNKSLLSKDNLQILNEFLKARESNNIFNKIFTFKRLRIRRQHMHITLALEIAFLIKKL
jgi:glycosyltransferase involved in cell wall biosynthesis